MEPHLTFTFILSVTFIAGLCASLGLMLGVLVKANRGRKILYCLGGWIACAAVGSALFPKTLGFMALLFCLGFFGAAVGLFAAEMNDASARKLVPPEKPAE